MGKVGHDIALHFEVGGDRRAAQLGVRPRGRVRMVESAQARNRGGELENPAVIDLVQHASCRNLTKCVVCTISRAEYIGTDRATRYASPSPAVPVPCTNHPCR